MNKDGVTDAMIEAGLAVMDRWKDGPLAKYTVVAVYLAMLRASPQIMNKPMNKDGYAWTPASGYKHYPPYINATFLHEGVRINARGSEVLNGEHPAQGPFVSITLPAEEAQKLGRALASPPVSTDGLVERAVREVVTDDAIADLVNVVTDLYDVDALDKAYPEVMTRLDEIVRSALTATLADRDATIERMLDFADELYRKYGVKLDEDDVAVLQSARNAALDASATGMVKCDDCGGSHDPDIRCPNYHAGMPPSEKSHD